MTNENNNFDFDFEIKDVKVEKDDKKNKEEEGSYSTKIEIELQNERKRAEAIHEGKLTSEIIERYDSGFPKREVFRDKVGLIYIVREYHKNGRYVRYKFSPGVRYYEPSMISQAVETRYYNKDGTEGSKVGPEKRLKKDKKTIGFYATKEVADILEELNEYYPNISKSDILNFCVQYTLEKEDKEDLIKPLTNYVRKLKEQGY